MILEIKNRTENWTTVRKLFSPKIEGPAKRLVDELLKADESEGNQSGSQIHMELFWRGYRDYCASRRITRKTCNFDGMATRYEKLFPDLHQRVTRFAQENPGQLRVTETNYCVNQSNRLNFFDNIRNTEIDIVIATANTLFIGEVKDTQTFGAKGSLVLAHQLLRQYITARMLVDEMEKEMRVIPFILSDSKRTLKNGQVRLMLALGYLDESRIFTWDDLGVSGEAYYN